MEHKKYSSYAFFIAKSVLRNFNVNLDLKQFTKEFENKESVYFLICQAPITNMFNSLINAQIKSYEQFVQKRLIDYYILNSNQNEEGESLEHPEIILDMNTKFSEIHQSSRVIEQRLYDCIAITNQKLGAYARSQIIKYGYLLDTIDENIQNQISDLVGEASDIKEQLTHQRQIWREFAIEVSQVISSVAMVRMDELDDIEQRAELDFFESLV